MDYLKPEIQVITLKAKSSILSASDGEANIPVDDD